MLKGWKDFIAGNVLGLHMAFPGLILDVIPESCQE